MLLNICKDSSLHHYLFSYPLAIGGNAYGITVQLYNHRGKVLHVWLQNSLPNKVYIKNLVYCLSVLRQNFYHKFVTLSCYLQLRVKTVICIILSYFIEFYCSCIGSHFRSSDTL